jgi:Na+/proline symporter
VFGAAIWFIPPMTAKLMFPQLDTFYPSLQKPAEGAYAAVAFTLLPTALLGVMVAGILSTTLGTFSIGLNQTAAIFTRDVYKTLFRANASPRELFIVGQIATLLKGVICMTIAIIFANVQGQGVFEIMLTTMALVGTPLNIPLVMCLFIKKLPHWSMLFSIIVGCVCSLIAFLQKWSFEASVFGITAVTASAVLITLLPAKLGFLTRKAEYISKVDSFFKRMKTPVDFQKEIGTADDYSQFSMLAMVLFIFGGFVLSLSLFTKALWELYCVLFAGGCILFIAVLFQWIGSKNKRPCLGNITNNEIICNFASKEQK